MTGSSKFTQETPPPRQHNTAGSDTMVAQTARRQVRPSRRPNNSIFTLAPAFGLDQHTAATLVSDALRREYGNEKAAAKAIALVADSNERTARNWLEGKCLPDFMNMVRLMASSPELKAEVARITEMQMDLDPDAQRAMSALAQLLMERKP